MEFESLTGKTVNCVVVYNNQASSWATWELPWFVTTTSGDNAWLPWLRQSTARSLVITQSLVPLHPPANWRTEGSAGAYDAHIRAWAENLVSAGLGNSVVRLAAEMNGDWNVDNIGTTAADYAAWTAYWRRFVQVTRSVSGAHFQFDWNVNAAVRPVSFADYYPGDDVVDIMGIDQYDAPVVGGVVGGIANGPTRWQTIYNAKGGLGAFLSFAAQHHKPVSFPEWGLQQSSKPGVGGDDPYYVQQMTTLFKQLNVSYQGIWFSNHGGKLSPADAPASTIRYVEGVRWAAWRRA